MLDLKVPNTRDASRAVEVARHPALQRMKGRGFASVHNCGGRIRLRDLHQSGSAKVFLPKIHAATPEIVFLNTAGGVTGGDHIDYALDVGDQAQANATTQTAERAYEASYGTGKVNVNLSVGEGARLDWLPQETILFEGSNMARKTLVNLAQTSEFLMVETIVLGRTAMKETLKNVSFSDWREVRRAGKVQWVEPFGFDARVLSNRDSVATFAGSRAFATIAMFSQGAEDSIGPIRSAASESVDTDVAASGWNGRAIVRLRSHDLLPLHKTLTRILNVVRRDPLPRVWQK